MGFRWVHIPVVEEFDLAELCIPGHSKLCPLDTEQGLPVVEPVFVATAGQCFPYTRFHSMCSQLGTERLSQRVPHSETAENLAVLPWVYLPGVRRVKAGGSLELSDLLWPWPACRHQYHLRHIA